MKRFPTKTTAERLLEAVDAELDLSQYPSALEFCTAPPAPAKSSPNTLLCWPPYKNHEPVATHPAYLEAAAGDDSLRVDLPRSPKTKLTQLRFFREADNPEVIWVSSREVELGGGLKIVYPSMAYRWDPDKQRLIRISKVGSHSSLSPEDQAELVCWETYRAVKEHARCTDSSDGEKSKRQDYTIYKFYKERTENEHKVQKQFGQSLSEELYSAHGEQVILMNTRCDTEKKWEIFDKLIQRSPTYIKTRFLPGMSLQSFINARYRQKAEDYFQSMALEEIWQRLHSVFKTALYEVGERIHRIARLVHGDITADNMMLDRSFHITAFDWDGVQPLSAKGSHRPEVRNVPYSPPDVLQAFAGNPQDVLLFGAQKVSAKRSKVGRKRDAYYLACALGQLLVVEFDLDKLNATESLLGRAMLTSMLNSLLEEIVLPMYEEEESKRQSVQESLERLKDVNQRFSECFAEMKAKKIPTQVKIGKIRRSSSTSVSFPSHEPEAVKKAINKFRVYAAIQSVKNGLMWFCCLVPPLWGAAYWLKKHKRRFHKEVSDLLDRYEKKEITDPVELLARMYVHALDTRAIKPGEFSNTLREAMVLLNVEQAHLVQKVEELRLVEKESPHNLSKLSDNMQSSKAMAEINYKADRYFFNQLEKKLGSIYALYALRLEKYRVFNKEEKKKLKCISTSMGKFTDQEFLSRYATIFEQYQVSFKAVKQFAEDAVFNKSHFMMRYFKLKEQFVFQDGKLDIIERTVELYKPEEIKAHFLRQLTVLDKDLAQFLKPESQQACRQEFHVLFQARNRETFSPFRFAGAAELTPKKGEFPTTLQPVEEDEECATEELIESSTMAP